MAAKGNSQSGGKKDKDSQRKGKAKGKAESSKVVAKNVTPEEAQFIEEHAEGLSKTTQRAKWIHSPDEHEDHPGQSLATRSHEVIRHWAEERGGKPATIAGTEYGDRVGVLRFNFPGFSGGDKIQEIAWEEWFKTFDGRELVFVFQEHKTDGTQSNFFRLDNPEREQA